MARARNTDPSLVSIRHDLEEIDRAIVLLVAARLETACAAIHFRAQRGEKVQDPAQEARVIARAQQWARKVGLSPMVVETIFRAMVDAGKDRFAALHGPPLPSVRRRRAGRHEGRQGRHRSTASSRSRTPTRK